MKYKAIMIFLISILISSSFASATSIETIKNNRHDINPIQEAFDVNVLYVGG